MRRIGIRTKFLYMFVGLVLLVGITVIILIRTVIFDKFEDELQKRAVFIAKKIAEESINPLLTENLFALQRLAIDHKNVDEDVEYLFIADKKKNILAHTFGAAFPTDLHKVNSVRPGQAYNIQPLITEKGTILDIAVPILSGELGVLHAGISEEPIRKSVTGMVNLSIGIIIIVLLLGGGITIFFTTSITKPITELTKVAEAVGSGDFERKIHISKKDEIGQLAVSFNKMSENLKNSHDELEKINEELRKEIAEHKKTMNMLKEIESQQKAILDNINDIAWLKDREGRYIAVNESFGKICGIRTEDVIGKIDADIWSIEFANKYEADDREVMKTGTQKRIEEPLIDKDGKMIWMETIKTPIYNDEGEVVGTTGIARNIEERKRTEKVLRESEAKFRVVMETTASAVFIFKGTKFKFVNRTAEKLSGFSKKELMEMDFWDIAHPDFRDLVKERGLGRQKGDRIPDRYEIKILTKNGEEKWIDLTAGVVEFEGELAGLGTAFDITDRKHTEEALQESETKFRRISQEFEALLDTIPDILNLLSPDLKVIWANNGAASFLGKEPSDLIGQYCYKLWFKRSTPCPERFCPVIKSFKSGNPEGDIVTSPDGTIWDMRTFPIKQDDRVVSVIELGRDISEHRKLEAQLLQAQKMEAVGQLAGGVAHDFNNILTAIIGYGSLLQMKMKKDDPLRHNVDQILASSGRAAHLTQSLLAFSRKQIIDLKPVKLNEIVKIVGKLLLNLIGEDIELQTVLTEEDLTVMADSGQIEQVLMNLATNARDAMPDGGFLSISTELTELEEEDIKTYGYGNPGKYALISVTDTGIGMDEKTREKVFEPFFTTKEVGKGTGLGLSIVYGIVKQHNGYINVYSELRKGTTFKIYLPMIETEIEEVKSTTLTTPPVGGTETILLAEDDTDVRKFTKGMLEEIGYTVIEAVDGEDAINMFIEHKDEIQLLLLDVIMPKKNGKEAYEEIRKIRPEIKTMFMSGYTADVIQKKGIIEEGLDFVLKPVSPTDLLGKVREVLDR